MARSFRDLQVWQLSMELTVCVYSITAAFPKHELYGLISQMRRAAVSVSSNLAEGAGRGSRKEFRHFVMLARGSDCELHTQLLLSGRLGYCEATSLLEAERRVSQVSRMLNGLVQYLEAAPPVRQTASEHPHPI